MDQIPEPKACDGMPCPNCCGLLSCLQLPREVVVDYCGVCRGAFVEAHELLVDLPQTEPSTAVSKACPKGHGLMRPGSYYSGRLVLDRCEECRGIWFDTGEVVALGKLVGREDVLGLRFKRERISEKDIRRFEKDIIGGLQGAWDLGTFSARIILEVPTLAVPIVVLGVIAVGVAKSVEEP